MHLSSRSLRAICWQGFQALSDVHIACPSLTSVSPAHHHHHSFTTVYALSALSVHCLCTISTVCLCTVSTVCALSALCMHCQHCLRTVSTVHALSSLSALLTHCQHCSCTISIVDALSACSTDLLICSFASPGRTLWPNRHPSPRGMKLMSIKLLTLHWQAWAGCCFDLLVMLIAQGSKFPRANHNKDYTSNNHHTNIYTTAQIVKTEPTLCHPVAQP